MTLRTKQEKQTNKKPQNQQQNTMLFSSTACQSTDKITAVKNHSLKSLLYEKKYPLGGSVFPVKNGVL